jgi:hypothetical protein
MVCPSRPGGRQPKSGDEAYRGTRNVRLHLHDEEPIRVAFTVISLHSIAVAHSETPYQAPAHNYYQNNWMAGD